MKLIVSIPNDTERISITALAPRWHAAVTHGGFGQAIDPEIIAKKSEINGARQIDLAVETAEIDPIAARRFVKALVVGGENENGARELIRDRHLRLHHSHVAIEISDLPSDRFFRDAWRLDGNKIYVDLAEARKIFTKKILVTTGELKARLPNRIEEAFMLEEDDTELVDLFGKLKNLDLHALKDLIVKADSPKKLRGLWPDWLPTEEN